MKDIGTWRLRTYIVVDEAALSQAYTTVAEAMMLNIKTKYTRA